MHLTRQTASWQRGNSLRVHRFNIRPIHHHVVRALPGGDAGTVLKDKETKKTFTVDIAEPRKKLKAYLDKYNEKRAFPGTD